MRGARRRLLAGLLLSGSIAVLAAFAAALVGEAYGTVAAEQRTLGNASLAPVNAARVAIRLQPWRALFRQDLGWTLGLRGEMNAMRAEYRAALRWNPASAGTWLDYAQALARAHRIDHDYTVSVARAAALSHASPTQLQIARMGANHWNEGDAEDRGLWARSMSDALRRAPNDFLRRVIRVRREAPLCGYVGAELGLSRWCAVTTGYRAICDKLEPDAAGPVADQCRRQGFLLIDNAGRDE